MVSRLHARVCLCAQSIADATKADPLGKASKSNYVAYDYQLSVDDALHKVFKFSFLSDEQAMRIVPPRKVLLSPNKRFLLLIGAMHNGHSTLQVYARYVRARVRVRRGIERAAGELQRIHKINSSP